jgi:hypothetical protein
MTFKKGFDPNRNMKGRPKLGLTIAERIRDAMAEGAKGQEGYTREDAMIDVAIQRGLKGDFRYWEYIMNRAHGKIPDKLEMSSEEKPDLSKLTNEELAQYTDLLKKALNK